MKNLTILLLFFSIISFSQTQIGPDIDGEAASDNSGYNILSLSSDGNTVAIGARFNDGNGSNSGHVRVYEYINGTWAQLGSDIDGEAANDQSGFALSLSSFGNIIAVGAPFNDGNGGNSGHVRVYENINGTWTQIGNDIDGETAGDYSGRSVSLSSDGGIVAIGAIQNDGNGTDSGHVRVFENIDGTWTQIGSDIVGESAGDFSGIGLDLSFNGSVVAIGAVYNDGNGTDSGHVRVFQNINGYWVQIGNDIDGEAPGDQMGYSVSLSSDGNFVAVAANYNDGNGTDSGHVRVFENINGTWTQIGSDIDGEAEGDYSGWSISLSADGSILAVGAPFNDGNSILEGHVRIFKNINGTWTQIGNDINGEAGDDRSGSGVSLSSDGNILAVGAYLNDGNGFSSGHVRVYDLNAVLSSDEFVKSLIGIRPNPVSNILSIKSKTDTIEKVEIYSVLGKKIKEFNMGFENINTEDLSKGIYLLWINTEKGTIVKKLIKN